MAGKILVIGGNGNVGRPLVAELLRRGEKVLVGSRKPEPRSDGAEAVRLDLEDPKTLPAALEGVDRIYAVSPTGYLDQVGLLKPVIDAAASRGIKIVLQTAIGVEADDNIPFRQAELLLEKSGAPFVILRPNWFSDNFENYWLAGIRHGVIRVPAGEGKSSFIDARDIALAAAGALTTNRHDGKAFALTGPESLDYHEAAKLISAVSGKKVVYTPVSGEVFVGEMKGHGVPEAYAQLLAAIFHPVAEGWTAQVTDAVETLSGKPPRPLSAYLEDNAKAFA